MAFKIGVYVKDVQKKLIQLKSENSIFSTILNVVNAGESGDDMLDDWVDVIRPAIDIESSLKVVLKNAMCQELDGFAAAVKDIFTS